MRTSKRLFQSLLLLAVYGFFIAGCKKDEKEDNDTTGASDNAFAEATFNDVANIADQAAEGTVSLYKTDVMAAVAAPCAKLKRDSSNKTNPDTVTIDFGASNCLCADQRYRRGKIIVIYSGFYKDSLASRVITFDNYFVNDNQVSGSKTILNKGRNASGNLHFEIAVNGGILLANNAGAISWKSDRVREWTAGANTKPWDDDIYSITGTASGSNAKGVSFTAKIINPLLRVMSINCRRHFVKGSFEFTPSGKAVRTIDFGNGNCDDIATVSINGKTYTIHLK